MAITIKQLSNPKLVITSPELEQAKNFFAHSWRKNSPLLTKNDQGVWRNVWGQILAIDHPGIKSMEYQMTYAEIEFEDEPSLISFVLIFKGELDTSECQ